MTFDFFFSLTFMVFAGLFFSVGIDEDVRL